MVKQDRYNERWHKEVKPLYKKTGNNIIERTINIMTGKTKAARDYIKAAEKWNEEEKNLDKELYDIITTSYKETGKTYIERIINNSRYR